LKQGKAKQAAQALRSACNFWIAEQTLDHLHEMRLAELDLAMALLPKHGKVLEIGAGTGWQARTLAAAGYDVCAIDLALSNYAGHRVWPIVDYDGRSIPYDSGSFDVVFSSNVLEHIGHVREFQHEIHRVLKPEGRAVHLLPSSSWRFWTNVTYLMKYWRPPPAHGEHAANALSEIAAFRRGWWIRLFRETGWTIERQGSNGIFYTGSSVLASRLSLPARRRLSAVLGASCNVFVLTRAP
jgi:SAM-dependent methyltransferase